MKSQPEKRFLFSLALRLGMTVSRMLDELDSREICDWMAYFTVEQEEMKAGPETRKGDIKERMKAAFDVYNATPRSKKPKRRR